MVPSGCIGTAAYRSPIPLSAWWLVAAPHACAAGIAVGAIPFQRCQADGSSRGVSAGGEFLNRFGGQRLAADTPLAAGYFGDLHPGHPPHVLAFDRDHGISQFLDDLPLLLRVEHFFDQMDLYQWH